MVEKCFCSDGIQIFSDWIIPEGMIPRKLGNLYKNHPILSRVIAVPLAVVTGAIKPLLFPVMCAVGVIAMPIIALIGHLTGKLSSRAWMQAWSCCILGLVVPIATIMATAYFFPLMPMALLLLGFVSVSIICHVYKVAKEPVPIQISPSY